MQKLLTSISLAVAALSVNAAAVVPTYSVFGNLAGATFGGTGIPTNPTAITTANGLTLGVTAFGRYQNPPLSNNGAGTFYATPGVNNGLGPTPQALGTTWGFGYYINAGTAPLGGFQIDLYYDLDPAAGNDLSTYGKIDIDAALNAAHVGALTLFQDAQNLYASFFSNGNAYTTPPALDFDANVPGEYGIVLRVTNNGVQTDSAILVTVVPEPASLLLAGAALVGLSATRRRRAA